MTNNTREVGQIWSQKDQLEQTFLAGLQGGPEIKKEERKTYLGAFWEQVITFLTKKQVREAAIYPEIAEALDHDKFHKMILNASLDTHYTNKYQLLAKKLNKNYTIVSDSDFEQAAGLVVASSQAVELDNIAIADRRPRLQKLGVSEKLIAAAGKKICENCLHTILGADPREAINYSKLTWLDRLTGERCPLHQD